MDRLLFPALVLVGCGGEPEREFAEWKPAELAGDCEEEALYAEPYAGISIRWLPDLGRDDGSLPSGFGTVVTTQPDFEALLVSLGVEPDQWPVVDFETQQVGAVWLESCRTNIGAVELLRMEDASLVFDVTFGDPVERCGEKCVGLTQALVMNSFSNEEPATVCRRIVTDCAP